MALRNGLWPWFAIQVKTGMEKTANLYLENAGHECFLPVVKCFKRKAARIEEFDLPLFDRYLFCRMNPHRRLPALQMPGVIQIVGAGEMPSPVEEAEVAAIQRVTKSGLPVMPWPYLQVGHAAQMKEGPLRGLAGIVVKTKFRMKLVLSVSVLQRSVAVEIERNWIFAAAHQDLLQTQKRLAGEHRFRIDSARTQTG